VIITESLLDGVVYWVVVYRLDLCTSVRRRKLLAKHAGQNQSPNYGDTMPPIPSVTEGPGAAEPSLHIETPLRHVYVSPPAYRGAWRSGARLRY